MYSRHDFWDIPRSEGNMIQLAQFLTAFFVGAISGNPGLVFFAVTSTIWIVLATSLSEHIYKKSMRAQ